MKLQEALFNTAQAQVAGATCFTAIKEGLLEEGATSSAPTPLSFTSSLLLRASLRMKKLLLLVLSFGRRVAPASASSRARAGAAGAQCLSKQ